MLILSLRSIYTYVHTYYLGFYGSLSFPLQF